MKRLSLLLFFALVGAACSGGSSTTEPGDTGTSDDTTEDTQADTEISEGTTPVGDPCDEDAECESELCVHLPEQDAGLCTERCTDDEGCADGFSCEEVPDSGADEERWCVPNDYCYDPDGDGYGIGLACLGIDCDHSDSGVNIAASEVCDGIDNDCDGQIDDDVVGVGEACDTGFAGECAAGETVCQSGVPFCAAVTAQTEEICDNLDNDCDGLVDEDEVGQPLTQACFDGDEGLIGEGLCVAGEAICRDGTYGTCVGQVLPAAEQCDGLDNDCDGVIDDDVVNQDFYPDLDGDGFGDPLGETVNACAVPEGYADNADDCDDTNPAIRPGATELPGDGIDQNCDGSELCYEDADEDGYPALSLGTIISVDTDCDDPGEAVYVEGPRDCNDLSAAVYPGNPERCDELDNDCNDRIDDGAGCYPIDHTCERPQDCATGLCVDGFCEPLTTCVDDGTCPNVITTTNGGGTLASERFTLEITASPGLESHRRATDRFVMEIGPGANLYTPEH